MPDNKPSFISYIMLYPPISSNIPHIFVVKITITSYYHQATGQQGCRNHCSQPSRTAP